MARRYDPRDIITPDAFSVAPELLGMPLARPWRRGVAMLIDLALIGLLANANGIFLALAAGVFFFRLALRGSGSSGLGKLARGSFGCLGAVALFTAIVVIWAGSDDAREMRVGTAAGPEGEEIPITIGSVSDALTLLRGSADTIESRAAMERLVERLRDAGLAESEIRTLASQIEISGDSSVAALVRQSVGGDTARTLPAVPIPLDSIARLWRRARAAGDSAAEARWGTELGARLAAGAIAEREERIARLTERNRHLREELGETEAALEAERDKGLLSMLRNVADELGLGIGWSGLYFTFFTAFLKGRTPGKRLLRIRVLRLDGKPISWWIAFERFGGYAACVFTGLSGFFQIYWDRNRQGLQDKLVETVVVHEVRGGRPAGEKKAA